MPRPVHKFLARFEPTVWILLTRRAKNKGWSINRALNEAVKDATDE
jgi:hypothetical protein